MQAISQARFRNIKPRTREERQGMKDRESLEKVRLRDRSGGYHHYSPFPGISNNEISSSYFISEADRFSQDFAAEEKRRREIEMQRKQGAINRHREQILQRDLQRWQVIDSQFKRDEAKLAFKQARLHQGTKPNATSAFNPITLEYDNTSQGDALKKAEDQMIERMSLRMQNIDTRMNSGYNILTGDIRRSPNLLRPF
jgi:hypothetical protein